MKVVELKKNQLSTGKRELPAFDCINIRGTTQK
jgi:hypothetical protein